MCQIRSELIHLTPLEKTVLCIATLFTIPVPFHVLAHVFDSFDLSADAKTLQRLTGLSLFERYQAGDTDGDNLLLVNQLARPLLQKHANPESSITEIPACLDPGIVALDINEQKHVAALALKKLIPGDKEEPEIPFNSLSLKLARLAFLADAMGILNKAALSASRWLYAEHRLKEAEETADWAVHILERHSIAPAVQLLRAGHQAALTAGDGRKARGILEKGVNLQNETSDLAMLWGDYAGELSRDGNMDGALEYLNKARGLFEKLGDKAGMIKVLLETGRIVAAKGIETEDDMKVLVENLSGAYQMSMKLGHMEAIAATAMEFGSLLFQAQAAEQARSVLDVARTAYLKLQRQPYVERIEAMLQQLEDKNDETGT